MARPGRYCFSKLTLRASPGKVKILRKRHNLLAMLIRRAPHSQGGVLILHSHLWVFDGLGLCPRAGGRKKRPPDFTLSSRPPLC
jgi:hypothetical protein